MLEHFVRDQLATVAEHVRPAPDPLGRLLARRRRQRRTRTALAGTAAALALLAVVPAAIGPRGSVGPEPDWNRLAWGQRLVDSPPRGAVAAIPGYVADLSARLAPTHPDHETRVLLVDDVGAARIAYVVFPPHPGAHGLTYDAWYLAGRGASPDTVAQSRVAFGSSVTGVEPFTIETIHGAGVTVGLAPAGCEVATAPLPSALDWHTEPTLSYVVRSPADHRPEWWRVTCAGIIRYEGPAPNLAERLPATVTTRVRGLGRVERTTLGLQWGYALNGPPVLHWTGRISADGIVGKAAVTTAPAVRGGWLGDVEVTLPNGETSFYPFQVQTDPDTPSSLLAVRLGPAPSSVVLVVAPERATSVRAIHNAQSLADAEVHDDAAMLYVRDRSGLVVEALGPTGAVLASGPLADAQVPPLWIDRWSED